MTAFEQRLANIESELSAKCDENDVRRIVSEEIKKTTVEPLTTPIIVQEDQTTVTSVITEINVRKTRKNNLMVHGIKESNSQATEERKEHDLQVLKDIAATCKVNIDEFKTNKLGKFDKERATRPLLVSSDNPDLKIAILKNAHQLKGEESKFDKITLSHDMTRTERQEDKKLYEEAKEMEIKSKGNVLYKVRGPPGARRIIKLQKE
jgi:hypothetical protein